MITTLEKIRRAMRMNLSAAHKIDRIARILDAPEKSATLAALEGLIDQACENGCNHFRKHDGGESVEHSDACKTARAAISKAKGGK